MISRKCELKELLTDLYPDLNFSIKPTVFTLSPSTTNGFTPSNYHGVPLWPSPDQALDPRYYKTYSRHTYDFTLNLDDVEDLRVYVGPLMGTLIGSVTNVVNEGDGWTPTLIRNLVGTITSLQILNGELYAEDLGNDQWKLHFTGEAANISFVDGNGNNVVTARNKEAFSLEADYSEGSSRALYYGDLEFRGGTFNGVTVLDYYAYEKHASHSFNTLTPNRFLSPIIHPVYGPVVRSNPLRFMFTHLRISDLNIVRNSSIQFNGYKITL